MSCRPFPGVVFALLLACCLGTPALAQDLGEHGFVDSGGVKLHYVTAGEGPLVVMIHGFPDYWYTWRRQMPALSRHFQVVAYDQRGYNRSDQPEGEANYTTDKLVEDLVAVLDHFQREKATIVGHDWGGLVAWTFAMKYPERAERLVILNLPHPRGLLRELANNPAQQRASEYARIFQKWEDPSTLPMQALTFWIREKEVKQKYEEAFRRSSKAAMLNYYKANYPREPYGEPMPEFPKVQCPVLMFHGLRDQALLPGALDGTWNWVDNELTLITLPDAGHFVQHDAADVVTRRMAQWLSREQNAE